MKTYLISILLLVADLAHSEPIPDAHNPRSDPSGDNSSFILDHGLVNKIHANSIGEKDIEQHRESSLRASIGFFTPEEFILENDYFVVDYAEQITNVPFISLSVLDRKFFLRNIGLNLKGQMAYSLSQQSILAQSMEGVIDIEDNVTVQWLPMQAGLSLDYNFISLPWLIPSLDSVVGASWFHQSGNVDGIDHSEWIAEYGYGVSLTLFSSPTATDGFSGIVIGMMKNSSFDSKKKFKGTRFNVGSSIRL